MTDVISVLRQGGVPVDQMSENQRQSVTGLSGDEAGILIKVHQRLTAAAGEVEAQGTCYIC